MRIETTKIWHSQNDEYKDIAVVLRKPTEGRRVKIQMDLADARSRVRDLLAKLESLKPVEGDPDAHANAQLNNLSDEIGSIISGEISPAWIRWGIVKIEHLDFDGQAADVESFLINAPSDLYKEVLEAIQSEASLTVEKKADSQ